MASNIAFVCAVLIVLLPVPLIGLLNYSAIKLGFKLCLKVLSEKRFSLPAYLIPGH